MKFIVAMDKNYGNSESNMIKPPMDFHIWAEPIY